MTVNERTMSYRGSDVSAAYEIVGYRSAHEPKLLRQRFSEIGNDIYDLLRLSYSDDDGATWSEDHPYQVSHLTPAGTVRTGYGTLVADPGSGLLVALNGTSVMPKDHMLEALTYTFPTYRVSDDGGITWLFEDRIIQEGEEYDPSHPLQAVWTGRNAVHFANVPFFDRAGRLIFPVQITRLQPDGTLFCPPGALSFHEIMVMIGTWQAGRRLQWEIGERVILEPDVSTRGVSEGAVAEMPDGRFLMVMRGSNAGNPSLPGHKWYCTSDDGCLTWSRIEPWTWTDGTPFHSPASYSTIVPHSNGRYYWIGNLCDENPEGNGPDYPLVAGEVDPDSFLLIRDSVTEIDTWRDDDPAPVHLRNFEVHQERTGDDLILRMTRLWVDADRHMRGDAYRYRLSP